MIRVLSKICVLLFLIPSYSNAETLENLRGSKPNIIWIMADDLGYGDLSSFGQAKLRTPLIDQMAAEGMKLTDFYAGATVCAPSRSVLMTGQHTGHTVVRGNSIKPIVIQPGQPTVASLLKKAGYATACVGKWGIGSPDNLTNPNDVGFDHFFGYVNMWHAHNCYPEFLIRNGEVEKLRNEVAPNWKQWQDPKLPQAGRGVSQKKIDYAPDLFAVDALKFIRDNHKKPFFLFYSMNVPHANNEAGKAGMEVPDLYEFAKRDWPDPEKGFAAMLRNIDRDTGAVLKLLRELKIEKNTLVIFTSDNGPHQEGGHQMRYFDSNGKLRGMKRDMSDGGIRVPTIAWWPSVIKKESMSKHPAYFGDLMATACELAGVVLPAKRDSISFLATITGDIQQQDKHEYLYWEFYEQGSKQAVRFDQWKAIRKPMLTGNIELYDVDKDIGESYNIASKHPDRVKQAIKYMNAAHSPDENWIPPNKKKRTAKTSQSFQVRMRNEKEPIELLTQDDHPLIPIRGKSGIGGATFERTTMAWPESISVRLFLRGMESLSFSNGKTKLSVSVSSQVEHNQLLHLWQENKEGPQLDKSSPYWLEVHAFDAKGKQIDGLPEEGGYFELTLPAALFDNNPESIQVQWIDFYR